MNALLLTLFVSVVLGAFGVVFFVYTQSKGASDHNDRLSFSPLDDDDALPLNAVPQGAASDSLEHDDDSLESESSSLSNSKTP